MSESKRQSMNLLLVKTAIDVQNRREVLCIKHRCFLPIVAKTMTLNKFLSVIHTLGSSHANPQVKGSPCQFKIFGIP